MSADQQQQPVLGAEEQEADSPGLNEDGLPVGSARPTIGAAAAAAAASLPHSSGVSSVGEEDEEEVSGAVADEEEDGVDEGEGEDVDKEEEEEGNEAEGEEADEELEEGRSPDAADDEDPEEPASDQEMAEDVDEDAERDDEEMDDLDGSHKGLYDFLAEDERAGNLLEEDMEDVIDENDLHDDELTPEALARRRRNDARALRSINKMREEDPILQRNGAVSESSSNSEDEEEDDDIQNDYDDSERAGNKGGKLLASSSEGIIHVGSEYQASIVSGGEDDERGKSVAREEEEDRDTTLWLPPPGGVDDDALMEFCEEAMGIYMLSYDRALYILMTCGYDYKKALETIAARKTLREEWCDDDATLFRHAFCMYGKNFGRIRQTMPHRSVASIVNHYYETKKTQDYKSLLDQRIERSGFNDDTEYELDGGRCDNCQEIVDRLFIVDETRQCNTCMLYFKLMLKPRPLPKEDMLESSRLRRRGIRLSEDNLALVDEFVKMAQRVPPGGYAESREQAVGRVATVHMGVCAFQSDTIPAHLQMKEVEQKMMKVRGRVVRLEHAIRIQRAELGNRVYFDKLRADVERAAEMEKPRQRFAYSWTDQERMTAFHCFVRYGRDFEAVSEVVGTKSPDMIKSFYAELKEDIDKLIDEADEADAREAASLSREDMIRGFKRAPIAVVNLD